MLQPQILIFHLAGSHLVKLDKTKTFYCVRLKTKTLLNVDIMFGVDFDFTTFDRICGNLISTARVVAPR